MEGMLFWIEADAIIRQQSGHSRSLDDFCQHFFACEEGDPHPKAFTREDIVASLQQVVAFDWEGLIRRRVDMAVERFDPALVNLLGYSIQFSNKQPNIPAGTFRASSGLDLVDSIGAVIGSNGTVNDLLLDSPAYRAGLGPGMKIAGVNGSKFSANRMRDAIASSVSTGKMELMLVSGDSFENRTIEYDGGPRFMTLVRKNGSQDVLADILKPK